MGPSTKNTAKGSDDESEIKSKELESTQFIIERELTSFDGEKPDTFFNFQRKLNNLLEIYDVNSDEIKVAIFRKLLRGRAWDWYMSYLKERSDQNDEEPPSFQEVIAAAIQEYGTHDDPYILWCRLSDHYHNGDSIGYCDRHDTLQREVLSIMSAEQICAMEFIRGLQPEVAKAVSQKQPKTVREARRLMMLYEHAQLNEKKRLQLNGHDNGNYTQRSYVKKQKYNKREWDKGMNDGSNYSSWNKSNLCYNCQKPGHLAKNCRTKKNRP